MFLVRLLVALALLVLGAFAGMAATLVHQRWWGLLLGLTAATFVTRALSAGGWRFAFMLGWLGAVGYAVLPRTEGDYLIADSGAGRGLLGGSFLIFLAALSTLPGPGSRLRSRADDREVLEG